MNDNEISSVTPEPTTTETSSETTTAFGTNIDSPELAALRERLDTANRLYLDLPPKHR